MNGSVCVFLYFIYIINADEISSYEFDEANTDGIYTRMSSMLYRTVNKYYCAVESAPSHLIIYGTKSWIFPIQNVNLTLNYPTDDMMKTVEELEDDDYIITGFSVILYSDGDGTKGFIAEGGLLQGSIALVFVSANVSMIGYQFWLYGFTKLTHGNIELTNSHVNMCK